MDDTDDRESQSRVDDDVGDVPDVFDPSGETPEDSDRIANVPVRMTESSIRTVNRCIAELFVPSKFIKLTIHIHG